MSNVTLIVWSRCPRCRLTYRYDPPPRCMMCRGQTVTVQPLPHGEEPGRRGYRRGCRCPLCLADWAEKKRGERVFRNAS